VQDSRLRWSISFAAPSRLRLENGCSRVRLVKYDNGPLVGTLVPAECASLNGRKLHLCRCITLFRQNPSPPEEHRISIEIFVGWRLREMPINILNKQTVKIGLIGLGLMGSRLTERLHASAWKIQVWNRSPQPSRAMALQGIPVAESIAKLVADSDVVLSSLANDAAVESVYCNAGGVLSAARPGTVLLELSTISPHLSQSLHQKASA
jgi:hypothetical protein